MSTLQIQLALLDDRTPTIRPFVDDEDLLADKSNDQGLDPERLLPPLSSLLLPTTAGHSTIIGCCSCGETGCGSFRVRIRRDGNQVIWERADPPVDETLSKTIRFDLVQYLDAIDSAAVDRPGEGIGRRVARQVRLALGMYDQSYDSLRFFHKSKIDWISAWPWQSETVKASVSSPAGQVVHEYKIAKNETDREFGARIAAELNEIRLKGA